MKLKVILKYTVIIISLGALVWLRLKWFGGLANDNAGDYDGGRSKGEQRVEEMLGDQ